MSTQSFEDPAKPYRRPSVNLAIRRASLADAGLLESLFIRAFSKDELCNWFYQWPARDSPRYAAAMEETQRIRLPESRRKLVSSKHYWFIASDRDTGIPIGASGWVIPLTENAKHLERKVSYLEQIISLAYRFYDAIFNSYIAQKLHAFLSPRGEAMRQRRIRWRAEIEARSKPVNKALHEQAGYWYLASLCVLPEYAGRGVGSTLLKYGSERADLEDRAIYLTATPSGVRMYERAGYEIIHDSVVFEDEEGGPVPFCTMYRPPKSEREQEKL